MAETTTYTNIETVNRSKLLRKINRNSFEVDRGRIKYQKLLLLVESKYPSINKFCAKARFSPTLFHFVLYGKKPLTDEIKVKIANALDTDTLRLKEAFEG